MLVSLEFKSYVVKCVLVITLFWAFLELLFGLGIKIEPALRDIIRNSHVKLTDFLFFLISLLKYNSYIIKFTCSSIQVNVSNIFRVVHSSPQSVFGVISCPRGKPPTHLQSLPISLPHLFPLTLVNH